MITVVDAETKKKLQQFYVSCRDLISSNIVPDICVQRSFDEVICGHRGEDSWRPSHITHEAARRLAEGNTQGIQRAHGIMEGRMDRNERTMMLLTGSELEFDAWWKIWTEHDATVLVTREEHITNQKFGHDDVISIPTELNLFGTGGFSFKFRKKSEISWLKSLGIGQKS